MKDDHEFKEVIHTIESERKGSFHRVYRTEKPPMDFERMKFLCYFVAGMVAEVLGFGLGFVIVLALAGVFK